VINKQPLVSILIPAYNAALFISETIESTLLQTYTNIEIIICDDGSSDTTKAIIENYIFNHKNIILLTNVVNLGIAKTRNKLLDRARGEYIAWLDSDDIALNTRIEKQVNFLTTNPSIYAVGGGRILIDEFGNEFSEFKHSLRTSSVGFNQLNIIFRNLFCNSTMMMRVTKQRFNAEFPPAEDFEYWSRMILIEKLKIINLPYIFVKYRIHSNNNSSKNPFRQLLLNDKIVTRNINSQNNFAIKNLNNLAINHHLSEAFSLKVGFIIYIIEMISFYKFLYRVRIEFDINFFEYLWTLFIDLNYRVRALIKHLLRSIKR